MPDLFDDIIDAVFNRLKYSNKVKCEKCKTAMVKEKEYLYLLPNLKFDHKHVESAEYYKSWGIRLDDESQIPTGTRSFYLRIFTCPACGHKIIGIMDFLQVRDQGYAKGGGIYDYSEFADFILETTRE